MNVQIGEEVLHELDYYDTLKNPYEYAYPDAHTN